MVKTKKMLSVMLCILLIFSSVSTAFAEMAGPIEPTEAKEQETVTESVYGEDGNSGIFEGVEGEHENVEEDENESSKGIGEDVGDEEGDVTENEDNNNEEIDTEEDEIIEEKKGLKGLGITPFGVGGTTTYYVKYYYYQYDIKTGLDEEILIYTDIVNDLVVGEMYTFNAIDIEGYRTPNISSKNVKISDTTETIKFILSSRKHIKITFICKDSGGNIIGEPIEIMENYIGRLNFAPLEIEGYKTPENFYIDIEPTMVNNIEYTIIYEDDDGEIDTEPELDQITITIQYQDSEGNTIKESDVYTEAKTEPNEYYAPDIEGYIKPEDDTFIRGGILQGITHVEHTFVYTKELAYDPNEIIYMPDEGLRTILGFGRDWDITKGQMAKRKAIDFQYYMHGIPIYDYTGLEHAINVEKISISRNVLLDSTNFFETIQSLGKVKEFESDYTMNENDLSHLVKIKSIEEISLRSAGMRNMDYSTLEELKNLKVLDLSDNNITDISSLVGVTQLEELDLMRNSITSIEGLENLINLKKLSVAFNKIDFNLEPNKTIGQYFTSNLNDEFSYGAQSPEKLAIITVKHLYYDVNIGKNIEIYEPTVVNMFGDSINGNELKELVVSIVGNIEGYRLAGTPKHQNVLYYGEEFNLNFVYEKEALPTGTVYIYYLDENWNEIKSGDTYNSVSGTQTYYAADIEGYVKPVEDSITFTIVEEQYSYQHFFFYTSNEIIPTGTVYIHHQDKLGNTVRSTQVYYNVTGSENYYFTGDIYEGGFYYFVNQPNMIQIEIVEDQTEYHHIFIYNKMYEGTVTIHHKDEEGNELSSSWTTNVIGHQRFYAMSFGSDDKGTDDKGTDENEGYTVIGDDEVLITIEYSGQHKEHTFVYRKNVEPTEPEPTEPEPTEPEPTDPEPTDPDENETGGSNKEEPEEEPTTEPKEEIEEPKEEEVIPEEPVEETIEEEPTPIEPVVEDKPTPEIKERPEIKVTTEKVEDPTEPEIEEPVIEEPEIEEPEIEEPVIEEPEIEEPEIEEPAEEEIPNEVKGKIQVRYLFNGQLVDSEELTNLAMGSYNIDAKQIEGYEIIGTTQQEVELTEDMTSVTVNFELKVVEKEREPILPIVIPVAGTAGGLIVLLFYFRKRKNLKIYAVEGLEDNEIKRLLGKKNIKVHSDEIVIDLSRELDLIEDEDILRLHLSRSLSVKLQDKKVTIMNGNNKVYEVTIDEYVTTIDIEI